MDWISKEKVYNKKEQIYKTLVVEKDLPILFLSIFKKSTQFKI